MADITKVEGFPIRIHCDNEGHPVGFRTLLKGLGKAAVDQDVFDIGSLPASFRDPYSRRDADRTAAWTIAMDEGEKVAEFIGRIGRMDGGGFMPASPRVAITLVIQHKRYPSLANGTFVCLGEYWTVKGSRRALVIRTKTSDKTLKSGSGPDEVAVRLGGGEPDSRWYGQPRVVVVHKRSRGL